jgi:hypothetical protein
MQYGHGVGEAALCLGSTGYRKADPAEPAELALVGPVLLPGEPGRTAERRESGTEDGE